MNTNLWPSTKKPKLAKKYPHSRSRNIQQSKQSKKLNNSKNPDNWTLQIIDYPSRKYNKNVDNIKTLLSFNIKCAQADNFDLIQSSKIIIVKNILLPSGKNIIGMLQLTRLSNIYKTVKDTSYKRWFFDIFNQHPDIEFQSVEFNKLLNSWYISEVCANPLYPGMLKYILQHADYTTCIHGQLVYLHVNIANVKAIHAYTKYGGFTQLSISGTEYDENEELKLDSYLLVAGSKLIV
jgi:hypothetical protein